MLFVFFCILNYLMYRFFVYCCISCVLYKGVIIYRGFIRIIGIVDLDKRNYFLVVGSIVFWIRSVFLYKVLYGLGGGIVNDLFF